MASAPKLGTERLQTAWYKTTIGSWPFSFDVADLLRVIPEGVLGGVAGYFAEPKKAVLVSGSVGAAAGALARGQIIIETLAYPEEFQSLPPDCLTHGVFIAALDALVAGAIGAGISYLLRRK